MSVPYAPARWPVATATTGLWALAAASIVFWGLRLAAPSDAIAPPAVAAPQAVADPAAVAQLLGAVPSQATVVATPEAASRFSLLGVIADSDGQGAALLVVDGKPPKPFRVGAKVADGYVLQSVTTRAASFGASANSAVAFTLQLPTRPLAVMSPPPVPTVAPVVAPGAPR
ncbi:type II secretion system protein N [Variovorax sp. GT1P44]|uniref:type II secretion system protein N n=1 Tax=Variovorax sp. GT1P44 TaxID=3443742 RepID=UPI003F47BAE6